MNHHVHKPLLSRQEVAEVLGVSISTLARMLARNELEHFKVGRFVRIKAEALERYLAAKGGAA